MSEFVKDQAHRERIEKGEEAPRSSPGIAELRSVYDALSQAQDCIRGETPEDVTDAEAREDTVSKVRDAMRTIEAMQGGGVAQASATYTEICMNEKCPRGGLPVEIVRASPPSPVAGEITDAMVEAGARAAAEAAGFCWKHCAQSQWIRDMHAGLKAALSIPSTNQAPPKAWLEAKAEIDAGWPDDTPMSSQDRGSL